MGSPMGDVSVWLAYGGGFCIDREIAMDGGCYEFAPEGGNRNASPPGGHMGPPLRYISKLIRDIRLVENASTPCM